MKTGVCNLPLHPGKCPAWLFKRMKTMSGVICEWIVLEYGQKELLRRISNPFFFQALGSIIGFDWHSSGLTTTLCGALKESINEINIGIQVCGGKGATSRKTPQEIETTKFNVNIKKLTDASRLSAKVDNNCVQDKFQLYHHCFFFTEKGQWSVVQQGMHSKDGPTDRFGCRGGWARRYHWLSDNIEKFTLKPHSAICCNKRIEKTLDLTAKQSTETQKTILDIVKDSPNHIQSLTMPYRHEIKDLDISKRGLKIIKMAYEAQPKDFEELVALRGLGPKTLRSLTLISDLVYGTETSWKDPVKYSFAHGGKDGIPYPVNKPLYDKNINVLRNAIEQSKLGNKDRLFALKKLNNFF